MIRPAELIEEKREGGEHDPQELAELILAYARDEVPDYQMAAWCMRSSRMPPAAQQMPTPEM